MLVDDPNSDSQDSAQDNSFNSGSGQNPYGKDTTTYVERSENTDNSTNKSR